MAKEGFCLMIYECRKCKAVEILWNSRDGVTPFMITCSRCGELEMAHIFWNADLSVPDLKPPKGMRIFRDKTKADVEKWARVHWDRFPEEQWNVNSVEDLIAARIAAMREGDPWVEVVGEDPNANP